MGDRDDQRTVTDEAVRALAREVADLVAAKRRSHWWARALTLGVATALAAALVSGIGLVRTVDNQREIERRACESRNDMRAGISDFTDVLLAAAAANRPPGRTVEEQARADQAAAAFGESVREHFTQEVCR